MANRFAAVIFDCDGVLVNSEEIARDAILAVSTQCGMQFTHEAYAHLFMGLANQAFREAINQESIRQTGDQLPADFFDRIRASVGEAYQTRLSPISGIHDLLEALSTPVAVASSSEGSALQFKLRETKLHQHFGEFVYSADDVEHAKPHPELFLMAAERVGAAADAAVAIEDSANGVRSAKRAGMTVIGFCGGAHCPPNHEDALLDVGADLVFHSHAEIQRYLT